MEPRTRASMDSAAQISFQALVDLLGLPVGLRVIQGAHAQLSLRQTKQLLSQGTGEDAITVRNDRLGQTMQFENMCHVCLGDC